MKVIEIVEILNENNVLVEAEDIILKLYNVGIDAEEDTDIQADIVKKLLKSYKVELKPKSVKKAPKVAPTMETPKVEPKQVDSPKVEPKKAEAPKKVETPKVEPKKTEAPKAPVKQEQPKKVEPKKAEAPKKTEAPKAPVKQEQPKKVEAPKKPEPKKVDLPKPDLEEVVETNVELTRVYDDKYDSYIKNEEKQYTRLKNVKKKKHNNNNQRQNNLPAKQAEEKVLYYTAGMTVAEIADGLGVAIGEVVRKLVMLGYMVSASEVLERDVIEIIVEDYNYELKDKTTEDITKFEEIEIIDDPDSLESRPAIVTIMGHVDHGKTTLLDTIRNSHVVNTEAGGITQHIGAYQVEKNGKLITFIDTPGHAAFTEMRARGAMVTDIVILVVAADDGAKPQTIEAIEHAKAAKVPIIVAVNKMDKPTANPDRVKQELASFELLAEDWGGSTIFVPISALTGKGVDDLLEMVLLTAEMEDYKANPNRLAVGSVIEARLDKGRGPVATLLVKNGTMKVGDPIVVGNTYGKIRAMTDETKANLKQALPSKAVEVTGLVDVPSAGDRFMIFEDEKTARLISEERTKRAFEEEKGVGKAVSLASLFESLDKEKELNLIIKGDVQGSLEALKNSLNKLDVEGVKVNIIRSSVGTITDTDISLAIASNSIIIAFNIRPASKILDQAKEKHVEVRMYNIIYKLLEDIEDALHGMLDPVFEEVIQGQAEVRSTFKVSKLGTIAGCFVTDGMITRNSDVRLIRDSIVVYTGKIDSLKRFKDDVKEVKAGYECGLMITNFNDIKEGDIVEAFSMEKVK